MVLLVHSTQFIEKGTALLLERSFVHYRSNKERKIHCWYWIWIIIYPEKREISSTAVVKVKISNRIHNDEMCKIYIVAQIEGGTRKVESKYGIVFSTLSNIIGFSGSMY